MGFHLEVLLCSERTAMRFRGISGFRALTKKAKLEIGSPFISLDNIIEGERFHTGRVSSIRRECNRIMVVYSLDDIPEKIYKVERDIFLETTRHLQIRIRSKPCHHYRYPWYIFFTRNWTL